MILISTVSAGWRRRLRTALLPLALPVLLAACATPAPPTTGAAPVARTYRDHIELDGRLSVRYQQNGKDETLHGSFTWAQTPDSTHVVLSAPLGQTIAAIDVTPGSATLLQANRPPLAAADVDTLATQALGWPLPVAGLRDWLQGFVADADGRRHPVPYATDATLENAGWRIRYAGWQEAGAAAQPKRIDLERDSGGAGPVAIRIVIDNWQAR